MIAINGRFLSQPVTGVQRYARELSLALDDLLCEGMTRGSEPVFVIPPNATEVPSYRSIEVRRVGSRVGHAWEQIDLPRFIRGQLLFTPCGGAPLIHDRHVITIHDAGLVDTPSAYSSGYRTWYKWQHGRLAGRAKHVLTVSEFSRQRLMQVFQIPASRITAIPLSGEHILRVKSDQSIVHRFGLRSRKFILAVSSRNPNKNFKGLLEALKLLSTQDIQIAIAGAPSNRAFSASFALPSCVKELGYVSDAELRALYENAACFVFPSLYEGFGLPPLEALTLGCSVVVSNRTSLPEVFKGAVLYCDPEDPSDIAKKIARAMNGEGVRDDSAREYARQFCWRDCARMSWERVALEESGG